MSPYFLDASPSTWCDSSTRAVLNQGARGLPGGVRHTITDDLIDLLTRQQPELPLGATARDQICSPGQDRSWSHIFGASSRALRALSGGSSRASPTRGPGCIPHPRVRQPGQACPNTGRVPHQHREIDPPPPHRICLAQTGPRVERALTAALIASTLGRCSRRQVSSMSQQLSRVM